MSNPNFQPVFRILKHDIPFIIIGLFFMAYFFNSNFDLSLISFFAVSHFFLFCNIFRIRRKPELLWAGVYVLLCYLKNFTYFNNWLLPIGLSISLSSLLIFLETKHPSYHGVFWRKFNPKLESWFNENITRT